MDNMGWHGTNSSSLWNNDQLQHDQSNIQDHQRSFMAPNTSCYVDLTTTTDDIFHPIEVVQKAQASLILNSNLGRLQDGLMRNIVSVDPFGMAGAEQSQIVDQGLKTGKTVGVSTTCSLDSLDCLLSATNSNTDTSVEDDGISMIFSDCRRNLWNFGGNSTAVSSGESEEAISQSSCERNVTTNNNNNGRIDQEKIKPNSIKRSHDQISQFHLLHQTDSSITEGGFRLISENNNNPPRSKKPRSDQKHPSSSNINFQQPSSSVSSSVEEPDPEAIAQMKEMIYRAAAFRPVNLGLEVVEKPKRKNVKISTDPQTVAARQRRERISERIRVLQKLVPGGSKMDTASMLDEAANYLKFLRSQVKALENIGHYHHHQKLDSSSSSLLNSHSTNLAFSSSSSLPFNQSFPMQTHFPVHNHPPPS